MPRPKPLPPVRLVRPSDAARLAERMQGQPAMLSIRLDKTTLRAIHRAAVMEDKTVKRFVLELLKAHGVDVLESDLAER